MRPVAPHVHQLTGRPAHLINQYLVGDVLIDAGTPSAHKRILLDLQGHHLEAHALTHAHPDHYGSSHKLCERLSLPLWCPQGDVAAVQTGAIPRPSGLGGRLVGALPSPPSHPVARGLSEGDEVAGFTVLDTPGHSPGHVSFWRESDRVLIVGDVLVNLNMATGRPGLHEPPKLFTVDLARNRESARRLAALEPSVAVFGHGPPLRDPRRLQAFVAALPS